jgi:hypothetical protein
MRSAKVWAHKDEKGKKYYRLLIDDGREEHLEFLQGLSAQQSFVALSHALDEDLGEPCCLEVMNLLVVFDKDDGLSEEQARRVFDVVDRAIAKADRGRNEMTN